MLCRSCIRTHTAYIRALHTSSSLNASRSNKPSRPGTISNPSRSTPAKQSPVTSTPKSTFSSRPLSLPSPLSIPPSHTLVTTQPKSSTAPAPQDIEDWPWVPIHTSKSGDTLEERVLFARPFENASGGKFDQRPILCGIVLIVASVAIFGSWKSGMGVRRKMEIEQYREIPKENRRTLETIEQFFRVAYPYLVTVGLLSGVSATVAVYNSQLKTVVRLSLIRTATQTGQGGVAEVVRLIHGMHALKPGRPYRDVPLNQIQIGFSKIYTRSSRLVMDIPKPGRPKYLAFMDTNYQLNFGESVGLQKAEEDGAEVVFSFKRLEGVFGKIKGEVKELGISRGLVGLLNRLAEPAKEKPVKH